MRIEKIEYSISKIIAKYNVKFAAMSDAEFVLQPPILGWSYSEVFSHIFDASLLSFQAIKNCSSGKADNKPTHNLVKAILWFGAFPPGKRYQVPKSLAERVKKISKADAEVLIRSVQNRLTASTEIVKKSADDEKIKHPRLGYLNAKQWFRFTEIHLKHHLKQLNRIEKSFSQRI